MDGYSQNEGIMYCLVFREDQVLSQGSSVKGNFLEFSRKVLEKSANSSRRDKETYASGKSVLCLLYIMLIFIICSATCCIICEMVQ